MTDLGAAIGAALNPRENMEKLTESTWSRYWRLLAVANRLEAIAYDAIAAAEEANPSFSDSENAERVKSYRDLAEHYRASAAMNESSRRES